MIVECPLDGYSFLARQFRQLPTVALWHSSPRCCTLRLIPPNPLQDCQPDGDHRRQRQAGGQRCAIPHHAVGAGAPLAGASPPRALSSWQPPGSWRAAVQEATSLLGDYTHVGRLVTLPVSQVLLGPLKEMLESLTLQQEVMREMVAAVGDAERGKQGALNAFLAERHHLRLPREETDRLRQEVRGQRRG